MISRIGKRLVAEDADGQFPAGDKFFDQQFALVLCGSANARDRSRLHSSRYDADRRSLAGALRTSGKAKLGAGRDRMTSHSGVVTSMLPKFFLGANFVESSLASLYSFARVSDAAVLQNSLDLAIFAEGSVNGEERKIDIVRQFEVLVAHVDIRHLRA